LNVKRIIGRVVSELQKNVLEAMQIEDYIMPEEEAAERLAMRLDNVDIIDSFKISDRYSIVETRVPTKYVGMTLKEANLTNQHEVIVLITAKADEQKGGGKAVQRNEAAGIGSSETKLTEGDLRVLFGELSNMQRLIQKTD